MATVITEECINCGACEPECPNGAIYQAGVGWEIDGTSRPPISDDVFYIVPGKCTECVGFYDHEACAAACPVDCCVPDPKIPETEEQLVARARQLHPDVDIPSDFPSRFRKQAGGEIAPVGNAHAAVAESQAAATVVAPAAKPPPSQVPPPVVAAATAVAAEPAAPVPARPAGGRVEKTVKPPEVSQGPPDAKQFAGELPDDFEDVKHRLLERGRAGAGILASTVALLALPIVGALPHGTKKRLEDAAGGGSVLSVAGATGLNVVLNFFLYPVVIVIVSAAVLGRGAFTVHLESYVLSGLVVAVAETAWRLRHSLFGKMPPEEVKLGAAFYGPFLVPLIAPLVRMASRAHAGGTVAFDGFYDGRFEEKRERQRRYGEVYRLEDLGHGYLLRFEFPRRVPASSVKEDLRIADDMPDYDYQLALSNGSLVVRGRVTDPRVRKVASGAPSFPPDFTTRIDLGVPVLGFKHRYRDKTLEVILVKRG